MSLPPSLWFEVALLLACGWELWSLHRGQRGGEPPSEPGSADAPERGSDGSGPDGTAPR